VSRGRHARHGLAVVGLAALLASCAPRLATPPGLDLTRAAERFRTLLNLRREQGAAATASLVLWLEGVSERRLPGAQADLVLAAPDRVRLRVASMFGTALDLGVRGDSLLAWVPAWRTGLRVGSARESLGVGEPGSLAYRALSATWEPPGEGWAHRALDSLATIMWAEGQDSLAMVVGSDGLPVWVSVGREGTTTVTTRYRAWDRASGVAWPSHVEIEEVAHGVRLVIKATRLRFRALADTSRLAVRMPDDAGALTLGQLRAVLGRLGVY